MPLGIVKICKFTYFFHIYMVIFLESKALNINSFLYSGYISEFTDSSVLAQSGDGEQDKDEAFDKHRCQHY